MTEVCSFIEEVSDSMIELLEEQQSLSSSREIYFFRTAWISAAERNGPHSIRADVIERAFG
jgi:hypothetical protein